MPQPAATIGPATADAGGLRQRADLQAHEGAGRATTLLRYLGFVVAGNLAWEAAHLPLYSIWQQGGLGVIAIDVLSCTVGDAAIAGAAVLGALSPFRKGRWPDEHYGTVALLTVLAGLVATVVGEWLNMRYFERWAYSDLMPTLPFIGLGLSPIAQWTIIPAAAFWWFGRDRS